MRRNVLWPGRVLSQIAVNLTPDIVKVAVPVQGRGSRQPDRYLYGLVAAEGVLEQGWKEDGRHAPSDGPIFLTLRESAFKKPKSKTWRQRVL
jgi:hypothetical protein